MKVKIGTYRELTKLRNILQQVQQISFNYSMINKRYPFDNLNDEQADELVGIYKDLLQQFINLKSEYEMVQARGHTKQSKD